MRHRQQGKVLPAASGNPRRSLTKHREAERTLGRTKNQWREVVCSGTHRRARRMPAAALASALRAMQQHASVHRGVRSGDMGATHRGGTSAGPRARPPDRSPPRQNRSAPPPPACAAAGGARCRCQRPLPHGSVAGAGEQSQAAAVSADGNRAQDCMHPLLRRRRRQTTQPAKQRVAAAPAGCGFHAPGSTHLLARRARLDRGGVDRQLHRGLLDSPHAAHSTQLQRGKRLACRPGGQRNG